MICGFASETELKYDCEHGPQAIAVLVPVAVGAGELLRIRAASRAGGRGGVQREVASTVAAAYSPKKFAPGDSLGANSSYFVVALCFLR
jgi:hypothetical protein